MGMLSLLERNYAAIETRIAENEAQNGLLTQQLERDAGNARLHRQREICIFTDMMLRNLQRMVNYREMPERYNRARVALTTCGEVRRVHKAMLADDHRRANRLVCGP